MKSERFIVYLCVHVVNIKINNSRMILCALSSASSAYFINLFYKPGALLI